MSLGRLSGLEIAATAYESSLTMRAGKSAINYVARFEEAVFVLHLFSKKSRKTSPLDIELGKRRYREVMERRK